MITVPGRHVNVNVNGQREGMDCLFEKGLSLYPNMDVFYLITALTLFQNITFRKRVVLTQT